MNFYASSDFLSSGIGLNVNIGSYGCCKGGTVQYIDIFIEL